MCTNHMMCIAPQNFPSHFSKDHRGPSGFLPSSIKSWITIFQEIHSQGQNGQKHTEKSNSDFLIKIKIQQSYSIKTRSWFIKKSKIRNYVEKQWQFQNFWARFHASTIRICKDSSEHDSSVRTYGDCVLQQEHDSSAYGDYVLRFNQNITL